MRGDNGDWASLEGFLWNTYALVVDDLDDSGELSGGGTIVDEDKTSNLNVAG